MRELEPPVEGISLVEAIEGFYSTYGVERYGPFKPNGARFQVQASHTAYFLDRDNYMVSRCRDDDMEFLTADSLSALYEQMGVYYVDHDTSHDKNRDGEYTSVDFGEICEVVSVRDASPTPLAYTDAIKTEMAKRALAAQAAEKKALADAKEIEVRQRAADEAELARLKAKLGK